MNIHQLVCCIAFPFLSVSTLLTINTEVAKAGGNCNVFGCSSTNVPCNPFGCPNPGGGECTPFGCPPGQPQQQQQPSQPTVIINNNPNDGGEPNKQNQQQSSIFDKCVNSLINRTLNGTASAGGGYLYKMPADVTKEQMETSGLRKDLFGNWWSPDRSTISISQMSYPQAIKICSGQ